MTATEIEDLVANDRIQAWEAQNEPDPDFGREKEAAGYLELARIHLNDALDYFEAASTALEGLKAEEAVLEKIAELEDLINEVEALTGKLIRGDAA